MTLKNSLGRFAWKGIVCTTSIYYEEDEESHLAIGGGLGWVKWLRNGVRFYLSCNYSCNLYFLVKIQLLTLKNFTSVCSGLDCGATQMKP